MLYSIACEHHFFEKFEVRWAILEIDTNVLCEVSFVPRKPTVLPEFSLEQITSRGTELSLPSFEIEMQRCREH